MLGWFSQDAGNLDVRGNEACLAAGSRRRLQGDRRGNVAIIVAVTAIPVVIAVGAGIDLSRMAKARATLQNAVDAAALAGSTLYTSVGQKAAAQSSAQNYFDKYALGGDLVASGTATAAQSSTVTSSPSVAVSATATLSRTFGVGTMTVTAKAVASNVPNAISPPTQQPSAVTPISQVAPGSGSPSQVLATGVGSSSAYDWNSVYMYGVPTINGQLDYTSYPPLSQFYEIGSNCNLKTDSLYLDSSLNSKVTSSPCKGGVGAAAPQVSSYKNITSDTPIAFLFVNMNSGIIGSNPQDPKYPSPYAVNQYGSQTGWYQVMTTATLALGQSPSQITDTSVAVIKGFGYNLTQGATHYSDVNKVTLSNCAVQIVLVPDINNPPTSPPYPGVCLAPNDPRSGYQYANLTCRQINGRTFMYWWNDMGGPSDDKDYKNFIYTMTCQNGTTNPDGGTIGSSTPVQGQPVPTGSGSGSQQATTTPRLIQ